MEFSAAQHVLIGVEYVEGRAPSEKSGNLSKHRSKTPLATPNSKVRGKPTVATPPPLPVGPSQPPPAKMKLYAHSCFSLYFLVVVGVPVDVWKAAEKSACVCVEIIERHTQRRALESRNRRQRKNHKVCIYYSGGLNGHENSCLPDSRCMMHGFPSSLEYK